MPSAPDQQATRRLGGAILLVAALAFVAIAVVPRLQFVQPHRYRFEVPLDRGVGMLEVDSSVVLAGLPVGRVTAAEPARSRDGRFDVVAVEIAVDPDIRLGEGTSAQLVVPLLGTGTDVRLLPSDGRPLADGETIAWIPPPGFLETLLGARQARSIRGIEEDLRRVGEWYDAHDDEIAAVFDEIGRDVEAIDAARRRDFEAWSTSWSRLRTGLDGIETAASAIAEPASRLSAAWDRLVEGFEASARNFGGVMPAGGGSLDELRMLSAAPDIAPLERRAAAVEAVWAALRPRWAHLISHVGDLPGLVRNSLSHALANTTLAGNELTGLLDSAESDPLPVAGEALGVLLGLIPSGTQRIETAKADALRGYVRAIMDLKATIEAIDRVNAIASGPGVAVPVELKDRLAEALRSLADAERAAVRAWTPAP